MAESHQQAVFPVVPGDPVPTALALVRAELDHAPGHRGPRVDMAVPTGPDEGIHIVGQGIQIVDTPLSRRGVRGLASRNRHQQKAGGNDAGDSCQSFVVPTRQVRSKDGDALDDTLRINSPKRVLAQANHSRVNRVGSS